MTNAPITSTHPPQPPPDSAAAILRRQPLPPTPATRFRPEPPPPAGKTATSAATAAVGPPESYGFTVYGDGPCYVVSVVRDSAAHAAGICPGDQLVQLGGHNVADMSAEAVRTLARHLGGGSGSCGGGGEPHGPPVIGVVSRVRFVELSRRRSHRRRRRRRDDYGLTVKGVRPTIVDTVDAAGPAFKAGVRAGKTLQKRCLLSRILAKMSGLSRYYYYRSRLIFSIERYINSTTLSQGLRRTR